MNAVPVKRVNRRGHGGPSLLSLLTMPGFVFGILAIRFRNRFKPRYLPPTCWKNLDPGRTIPCGTIPGLVLLKRRDLPQVTDPRTEARGPQPIRATLQAANTLSTCPPGLRLSKDSRDQPTATRVSRKLNPSPTPGLLSPSPLGLSRYPRNA